VGIAAVFEFPAFISCSVGILVSLNVENNKNFDEYKNYFLNLQYNKPSYICIFI
jgi:hypothetical protein